VLLDANSDINSKIWRYIDFPKYVDMLLKKCLFFSRLRNFDDPYEGRPTDYDIEMEEKGMEWLESIWGKNWRLITGDATPERRKFFEKMWEESVANCWHRNEYESAMLWKLYSNDNHGVVIQSTIGKLDKSLESSHVIMAVRYLDYKKENAVYGKENLVTSRQLFAKRKSFEHEQEIRVAIPHNLHSDGKRVLNLSPEKKGEYVSVDLDILIEKVYVNPFSEDWFLDVVKSITKEYLPNKEVERSKLYSLK